MIFQISFQYLLRPVPQVQRLSGGGGGKPLYLHAQVENIVSRHVLTKAAWPNHYLVAKISTQEMHAAQRRAHIPASPPAAAARR